MVHVSVVLSYWALPATAGLPTPALVQPAGNWARKGVIAHVTRSKYAGIVTSLRMTGLLKEGEVALDTPVRKVKNLYKVPKQHR